MTSQGSEVETPLNGKEPETQSQNDTSGDKQLADKDSYSVLSNGVDASVVACLNFPSSNPEPTVSVNL